MRDVIPSPGQMWLVLHSAPSAGTFPCNAGTVLLPPAPPCQTFAIQGQREGVCGCGQVMINKALGWYMHCYYTISVQHRLHDQDIGG